jgi:hypothetical protein
MHGARMRRLDGLETGLLADRDATVVRLGLDAAEPTVTLQVSLPAPAAEAPTVP